MTFWRQAGLNYIQYSSVAARMLRQSLKPDLKSAVKSVDVSKVKFVEWKDGKAIKAENK